MKRFAICFVALAMVTVLIQRADAQWVTRTYQPVWMAPQPVVVHRPVVVRQPVVVHRPPVVYTRHRPILGGTVVRTRPGGRYVVW